MSTAVAYTADAVSSCPEPPRAAPAARTRPGGGLRVRVPLRLVVGAQYSDAALSVYIKIAALAMRPEGCTAKVETLAAYLGMSKSAAERALKELANPDPIDGLIEVPTVRRTLPGGRGQSALRTVRAAEDTEGFVWIPARSAGAMAPRLLRLYALIAYATVRRQPLSYGELGGMLYHHSGASKGQHLGERQAGRLVAELAATGWITVNQREGLQGRHAYEAHVRPLQSADTSPDIHDGSGLDKIDGSLSEEDPRTDRLEKTQLGGEIRRRRSTGSTPKAPVDKPPSASMRGTFGRGQSEERSSSGGSADGSGVDLSPRVWQVLEPVRHLLGDVRPFVLRRIADEIGRQLAAGTGQHRLTERLTHRYATTEPPRDPGRWILGAGLPRDGCGLDACESGVIWHSGQDCHVCLDNALHRQQQTGPAQLRGEQPPPSAPAPAAPVPWAAPAPDTGLPDLTPGQKTALRAAAGPESIRAAIDQYGRAGATYLYGWRAVTPHLPALDDHGPEGDNRAEPQ